MRKIKEHIIDYWDDRASDFVRLHLAELRNDISLRWESEIERALGRVKDPASFKVLDVGCGSGFFSMILERKGFTVTATDISPAMIREAKAAAKVIGSHVNFLVMDVETLDFPDESFDLVIARNLTWTLPDLTSAYREWKRVLKPGGRILNFDADYRSYGEEDSLHKDVTISQLEKHRSILKELGQVERRPEQDLLILKSLGFSELLTDETISDRIYIEQDEFFNPVPMFLVAASKSKE